MAGPGNQGFCHVPAQGASPVARGPTPTEPYSGTQSRLCSTFLRSIIDQAPISTLCKISGFLNVSKLFGATSKFRRFQNYLGPPVRSGGFKTIWGHQQGPKVSRRSANTWLKEGQKGGEGVERGRGKTVSKCIIKGGLYIPKGCWATALRQRDNSYPLLWRNLLSGL